MSDDEEAPAAALEDDILDDEADGQSEAAPDEDTDRETDDAHSDPESEEEPGEPAEAAGEADAPPAPSAARAAAALGAGKPQRVVMVPAAQRRSPKRVSENEAAGLLGERVTQIEKGSAIMVDFEIGDAPLDIALRELRAGKFPLSLQRDSVRGSAAAAVVYREVFDVNEMAIEDSIYDT